MLSNKQRAGQSLAKTILSAAIASLPIANGQTTPPTDAQDAVELKPFVVTAPKSENALEMVLDAKVAYQPMPAQDGADFLKSVPGFSVIRKGGTDGDPVLRGMAGSRLGISIDGQGVLGGCSHRMDPPTAYVFPASFDRVTILKGPQSVLNGPGASAGVVRFESDLRRLTHAQSTLESNLTFGSFDRFDAAADLTVGNPGFYARAALTRTQSGDYEDGAGNRVHSQHERSSANASLGWTPDDATVVQYSATFSEGEAAYADRLMDGALFDRESHQIRVLRSNEGGLIKQAELDFGYAYIDHVMDTYSLRQFSPTTMMPNPTVSNPDRRTVGGKAVVELDLSDRMELSLGLDFQENRHRLRSSMNQPAVPYEAQPRIADSEFTQYGLFAETSYEPTDDSALFGGLRVDNWSAEDLRSQVSLGMMGAMPNPTAGQTRDATLLSGFGRYEANLGQTGAKYYVGLGYVERFLDYWELIANENADSLSGFYGKPEKTAQLDLGATKDFGNVRLTLSGFSSDINDFALVQNNYAKPSGMMGTRNAVATRGIDARTWGGEAALAWHLSEHLILDTSVAYTRGENRTDNRPLAQIAPLESRLSLNYTRRDWSVGGLLRIVDDQDRVAIGQGNIVGQDFAPTSGFAVASLNASWRFAESIRVSTGVDNLFGKDYAEHISRSGSLVPGFAQTARVNELGRTIWARLDYAY